MGLFNPKPERENEVHVFPQGITPKVTRKAWVEFELAYIDVTV